MKKIDELWSTTDDMWSTTDDTQGEEGEDTTEALETSDEPAAEVH